MLIYHKTEEEAEAMEEIDERLEIDYQIGEDIKEKVSSSLALLWGTCANPISGRPAPAFAPAPHYSQPPVALAALSHLT